VLLLGAGQGSSTAQHHGEVSARAKCFGLDTTGVYFLDEEGEVTAAVGPTWRSGRCPYTTAVHEKRVRYLSAVRDGYIGAAHVQMMRGSEVVKALGQLLRGETGVDYCAACDQVPDREMYENWRREHPNEQPSRWQ
jgi:hypothetical protein